MSKAQSRKRNVWLCLTQYQTIKPSKKKIVRPKYESTNLRIVQSYVWTGATKVFVRRTHPVTASRGQGNLVRGSSFFHTVYGQTSAVCRIYGETAKLQPYAVYTGKRANRPYTVCEDRSRTGPPAFACLLQMIIQ